MDSELLLPPPAAGISDASTAGQALLTAANAAAQRSALGLGGAAVLSVGTTAGTVAAGDDPKFFDARTPTAHATSHKSGGSDSIKLDELAAPTDITTLNASTSAHGLLPKVGSRNQGLCSDGTSPTWDYNCLQGFLANRSLLYWRVGATTSTFTTVGDGVSVIGTNSSSPGDANQPHCINLLSGSVAGNAGAVYGNTITIPRQQPRAIAIIRLVDTTAVRIWVSLHDGSSTTGTNADDPASRNLMGFRFSTDAGDTNWRCCTKDGSTLNNQDSGVAPSTSGMTVLEMEHTGSSVKFYINGTLVATSSSNLPSSTAACRLQIYAETRTSAGKNIKVHAAAIVSTF